MNCKSCASVQLLQYYGVYEGQTEGGEEFTTGFSWSCGNCHQEFRYLLEETKVDLFEVAPPPGWKSPFGPSVGQMKSIDPKKMQ